MEGLFELHCLVHVPRLLSRIVSGVCLQSMLIPNMGAFRIRMGFGGYSNTSYPGRATYTPLNSCIEDHEAPSVRHLKPHVFDDTDPLFQTGPLHPKPRKSPNALKLF